MSTMRMTEDERQIGNQVAALCESLREEAVEHILVTGLIAFVETRGCGARFDLLGWSVVVARSDRITGTLT